MAVHDDPDAFAEAAAALLLDEQRWARSSDAALRHMYDAVCRDEVLAGIFIIERGYRKGKDAWERKIFK